MESGSDSLRDSFPSAGLAQIGNQRVWSQRHLRSWVRLITPAYSTVGVGEEVHPSFMFIRHPLQSDTFSIRTRSYAQPR